MIKMRLDDAAVYHLLLLVSWGHCNWHFFFTPIGVLPEFVSTEELTEVFWTDKEKTKGNQTELVGKIKKAMLGHTGNLNSIDILFYTHLTSTASSGASFPVSLLGSSETPRSFHAAASLKVALITLKRFVQLKTLTILSTFESAWRRCEMAGGRSFLAALAFGAPHGSSPFILRYKNLNKDQQNLNRVETKVALFFLFCYNCCRCCLYKHGCKNYFQRRFFKV